MNRRGQHHARTGGLTPRKTAFDMSFEHKGTCELGRLIPVMCEEVYPGEYWDMSVRCLIRFHPQVAPLMHEVNVSFHDFFVPWRIIWKDWEEYITGGQSGTEADTKGLTPPVLPNQWSSGTYGRRLGSLIDYIYGGTSHIPVGTLDPDVKAKCMPIDAPLRVYWKIWNDYYRDENQQPRRGESVLSNAYYDPDLLMAQALGQSPTFEPAMRSWTKDYFTSALPFQQRGTAPAFPISIDQAPIVWDNATDLPNGVQGTPFTTSDNYGVIRHNFSDTSRNRATDTLSVVPGLGSTLGYTFAELGQQATSSTVPGASSLVVGNARVDGSQAILQTFDVQYLRYAVQIQKILERNARGGVRYNEWLYGHFGDRPRDERLDRPEYIGGAKQSVTLSEVLQTSSSAGGTDPSKGDTPQGTMSGHAIATMGMRTGKYRVHEHGYIMRIMSIMPTPSYEDGIDRMWFRRNRYDHLMPELVNLSEQAILRREIFFQCTEDDLDIWGYQPQYDELRIRRNRVSGELRVNIDNAYTGTPANSASLGYWHLGRAFDTPPPLGPDFIQYDGPQLTDRIMAVSGVHPVIFSVGNIARAVRPLPYIGEPGLVDHH